MNLTVFNCPLILNYEFQAFNCRNKVFVSPRMLITEIHSFMERDRNFTRGSFMPFLYFPSDSITAYLLLYPYFSFTRSPSRYAFDRITVLCSFRISVHTWFPLNFLTIPHIYRRLEIFPLFCFLYLSFLFFSFFQLFFEQKIFDNANCHHPKYNI